VKKNTFVAPKSIFFFSLFACRSYCPRTGIYFLTTSRESELSFVCIDQPATQLFSSHS
jgi:hypothetical protein